jgi:hypothetical protein
MLEERGQGVGAKGMTVRWRQAAPQVGDERFSRHGSRPEGCEGWAISGKEFKPTELASLEDAEGVCEGNTETVSEYAGLRSGGIQEFGHRMAGVEEEAWWSSRRRANASNNERCVESG